MDLSNYKPQWVELSRISFNNKMFQFRTDITNESVKDLAISMSDDGQKFPIILWQRNTGELQPISGYRRIAAAQFNGWEKFCQSWYLKTTFPKPRLCALTL